MSDALWELVLIPAILAFIFSAWVVYNILADVSNRNIDNAAPATECRVNCQPDVYNGP
jgi:hypothetical protein